MRILFLDVDGVLNTANDFIQPRPGGNDILNQACVNNLESIVFHNWVDTGRPFVDLVVLSSSWRIGGEGSKHMQRLRKVLLAHEIHIHSVTPKSDNGFRGNEIGMWFIDNFNTREKENVKYVILDDDADFHPHQKPFFVQTNFAEGLTKELAEKAIQILKG